MNFISHFYLLEDKANPDIVLGNLIPDLMRGFTKIYHQQIKNNKELINNNIVSGIEFHLKTDLEFHHHPFFIEKNKVFKKFLFDLKLPSKKYYLVTHILLELLIDRYLLETYPNIGIQFYDKLRISEKDNFKEKLKLLFNSELNLKIHSIFNSFIENKYAFALTHTEGIKFALNEIIGHKIGINFKKDDWGLLIEKSYENIKDDLPLFFNNINIALKNA